MTVLDGSDPCLDSFDLDFALGDLPGLPDLPSDFVHLDDASPSSRSTATAGSAEAQTCAPEQSAAGGSRAQQRQAQGGRAKSRHALAVRQPKRQRQARAAPWSQLLCSPWVVLRPGVLQAPADENAQLRAELRMAQLACAKPLSPGCASWVHTLPLLLRWPAPISRHGHRLALRRPYVMH